MSSYEIINENSRRKVRVTHVCGHSVVYTSGTYAEDIANAKRGGEYLSGRYCHACDPTGKASNGLNRIVDFLKVPELV